MADERANRKMSADGTDISSKQELGLSLQQLYDTLNLALEKLAGTDIEKAEQIVRTTYLLDLYRFGHSLLIKYQKSAAQLLSGPIGPFMDYPEQLFLDALQERPPVAQNIRTLSQNVAAVNQQIDQVVEYIYTL